MRTHRVWAISFLCALIPAVAVSCSSGGDGGGSGGAGGNGGGGSGGNGSGSGSGGSLTWYTTCGAPVCGGPGGAGGAMAPPGVDPCTTEKEGDACSTDGATCWPGGDCGVLLLCAKADPKGDPPNCPISRARYKKDIEYLPEGDLQRVHDDLMTMRLARWRYTSEASATREHLGFIIDDSPESPAVKRGGDQVDLYGYTSMAVAAAQIHDTRIDALEREIRALREELASLQRGAAERAATPGTRCDPGP